MCGRIAHEWPGYSVADVARLPYTHYRALRALLIRYMIAQKQPNVHAGPRGENVRVLDVDKHLGISDG